MTYLETLYGGQYHEINQRGGDTSKARMNGNVFLAALFILLVMDVILLSVAFEASWPNKLSSMLSGLGGKAVGKLLAFVLMIVFYFLITLTIGNEKNYNRLVEKFNQYPEAEKNKAKWKALIPFGVLLVVLIIGLIAINR